MKRVIKLKEMTSEELSKWKGKNCLQMECKDCPFGIVVCNDGSSQNWLNHKEMFSEAFLNQKVEIEIEEFLDDVERRYLEGVIKPFENSVNYLILRQCGVNEYYLTIEFIDNGCMCFPSFEKDKMYKNLELGKKYTLSELKICRRGKKFDPRRDKLKVGDLVKLKPYDVLKNKYGTKKENYEDFREKGFLRVISVNERNDFLLDKAHYIFADFMIDEVITNEK